MRISSSWHSDRENFHNQLQGRTKTRTDSNIPIHVPPHVGAGGPGVPAGAVRAQRRVLADRVLEGAAPRRRTAPRMPTAAQTSLITLLPTFYTPISYPKTISLFIT